MSGRDLSRRFYAEVIRPAVVDVLGEDPYAVAMLGDGSDVLGYDDDVSSDHDYGPKVQLVLPASADPGPLLLALTKLPDWLTAPTQILATLATGPVLHDPAGLLTDRRAALRWYPDDIWRYVLAAGWLRIDQEEPFVGRTG